MERRKKLEKEKKYHHFSGTSVFEYSKTLLFFNTVDINIFPSIPHSTIPSPLCQQSPDLIKFYFNNIIFELIIVRGTSCLKPLTESTNDAKEFRSANKCLFL